MDEEILRLPAVKKMTGMSRSSIYQMESDGRFPQRRRIGLRAVGWMKSDIKQWIANRVFASPREGAGSHGV